jgi:hypothetical protein
MADVLLGPIQKDGPVGGVGMAGAVLAEGDAAIY